MNVLNERNEKNQGKKVLSNVKGDIEIKNLSFQYGDNDRSVLTKYH